MKTFKYVTTGNLNVVTTIKALYYTVEPGGAVSFWKNYKKPFFSMWNIVWVREEEENENV